MPLYSAQVAVTVRYTADSIEAAREVVDLMHVAVDPDRHGKLPSGFEPDSLTSVVRQITVSAVPPEDAAPI